MPSETVDQHQADLVAQTDLEIIRQFNYELAQIDPKLQLVRASQNATMAGLMPGYFHVLRDNGPAPASIIVIEGEDGEFREPDSGLFEQLRRGDMWRGDAKRDRDKRIRRAEEARRRQRDRDSEERQDELWDRYKAKHEPGVSFADMGWRNRATARRG